MPRGRKSEIVDGFNVYKAAQRAAQGSRTKRRVDSGSSVGTGPDLEGKKIGVHIGRTVMPTKHDGVCYECGHAFQTSGSIVTHTICVKCRARLVVENPTIDAVWVGEIKTAGTVYVAEDGVVDGGEIRTTHLVLEGVIASGVVEVYRRLEVRVASSFTPETINARDLKIAAEVALIYPALTFHDVEVVGTLRTDLTATGNVLISEGGVLEGNVSCPSLVVREGGVLRAQVCIDPSRTASKPPHAGGIQAEQSA